VITIKRGSSKRVRVRWWQGARGTSPRINCTGKTCLVDKTTLPWSPSIVVVDASQGEFDLIIATRSQSTAADLGRTYEISLLLADNAEEGIGPDQNIAVQFT
jgi:hypothetical protein